jgi:hypothetical protein
MDSIIDIVEVRVSAKPGAFIGGCLKVCIELANKEGRNVRLNRNGEEYMVRPNDLSTSEGTDILALKCRVI